MDNIYILYSYSVLPYVLTYLQSNPIQKPHGHHGMQVTVYLQITVELPEEIAKLPKQDFDEAVREKGRWDRMEECSWFSITFFTELI
jgi:hypothetical protein